MRHPFRPFLGLTLGITMAKALKIIGGIVLLLVVLFAAAIFMISRIDPNEYIPTIKEQVRDQLGAELELESIEWKFWPNFALDLQGIKLSTQAKSHQQLLAVDNASVEVAVLPLLSKSVQVDHVSLKEPQIWFHQYADGTHNWQPLIDKAQSSSTDDKPAEPETTSEALNIAVDHVGITNGLVKVSGQTQAEISKFNLDIRNIQFTDPIPTMLSAHIKVTDPEPQEFDASFNSNININNDFSLIELNKMSVGIKGQEKEQTLTLNGNASINTVNTAIKTDLTLEPLNLDAWMTIIPESKESNASEKETAQTKAEPIELPKELIKGLNVEANLNLKDIIMNGASHHFEMEGKVQKGYVTMHNVKLEAYEGVAKGNVELDVNPTPAKLKVDLDVNNMGIADILKTWMGVQPISGTIKSEVDVKTTGDTVEELIKGLTGMSGLTMENATLPKVNFNEIVWNKLQSKTGDIATLLQQFPKVQEQLGTLKTPKILRGTTELDKLLAQIQITPQTIQSQTINATLDGQPIEGQFSYGRLTEKLTLKTAVKLPFEKQELADLTWPLSCTGSLAGEFSCGVDTSALKPLLKELAKNEVKNKIKEELAPHEEKAREELKEVEDKAKAKIEEKLGTSLKGLFGK